MLALELEVRPVVPEEHAAVPDRDDSIAPRASDLHVGVAVGADPEVTPDASQVPAAVPQTFGVDGIARGFVVGHRPRRIRAAPRCDGKPSFAESCYFREKRSLWSHVEKSHVRAFGAERMRGAIEQSIQLCDRQISGGQPRKGAFIDVAGFLSKAPPVRGFALSKFQSKVKLDYATTRAADSRMGPRSLTQNNKVVPLTTREQRRL